MTRNDLAIRTSELTKSFGDQTAVRSVDLEVATGEVFGLLGPNGSGKSTTMRMLTGLMRPSRGRAEVLGGAPGTRPRRVGALIEGAALYPYLTGRQNLQMLGRLVGASDEAIDTQLDEVGMSDAADRQAGGYSTGMRQRLGIALALVHQPELLLLDEPSAGLDPQGVVEIRKLLQRLGNEDRTIIVSSHVLTEIDRICDRVAILQHGEIVFQGDIDELHQGDVDELTVRAEPVASAIKTLEAHGLSHQREGDDLIVGAPTEHAPEIVRALVSADVEVFSVSANTRSLEEAYLELTST